MPASNGIAAFGTLIKRGDGGGPETFTTIAELRNITGPKIKRDTKDISTHSSPGGWKEFIATLIDGGVVTFDINYVPTGATHNASTGILADISTGVKRNFKLVFPDGAATTWALTAIVTDFEAKEPVDGELLASLSIKVSGQPTLA